MGKLWHGPGLCHEILTLIFHGLHVKFKHAGNETTQFSKHKTTECFHSRSQHLCKFIRTKESICIRKEYNSQRIGLGHQHGRRFIVLGQQYGLRDVM